MAWLPPLGNSRQLPGLYHSLNMKATSAAMVPSAGSPALHNCRSYFPPQAPCRKFVQDPHACWRHALQNEVASALALALACAGEGLAPCRISLPAHAGALEKGLTREEEGQQVQPVPHKGIPDDAI